MEATRKKLYIPPPGLSEHAPCSEVVRHGEKIAALENWRESTESDLKAIRDVISQVRLLMSLSIGGGGLSLLTLIITIATLLER